MSAARAITKPRARAASEPSDARSLARPIDRGLALGFVAMLPLFALYEIALASGVGLRSSAELFVLAPLRALGAPQTEWRLALLVLAALVALRALFHERYGLLKRVFATLLEGSVAALVLGPLLVALAFGLLGVERLDALRSTTDASATMALAAFVMAGAAWEELVFRVGLQSALFVVALETAEFLTGSRRLARGTAELVALAGSALVFAVAHLAVVLVPLGAGGEPFDGDVFAWRFLAGMLLGILFRLRGPGVAAWAHALLNLALLLGAGPAVFLA